MSRSLIAEKLEGRSFGSFRISARRADKRFHMTSPEINRELGAFVEAKTGARVDLTRPDLQVLVDVLPTEVLVYFDEVAGYGGLPVGVTGRVTALLSGGIDSPVAAWHMMKRGCSVDFVHFHSYPLVDRSSMEKAAELTQMLTRFQHESTLHMVPFGEIQQHIIVSTPPPYRVVLYRRFMMRIAEALARKRGSPALVTGDSLAQVSSQTLENITVVEEAASMPIFRPLIGFNKVEIIDVARRIGTYPVSILPDQDCCTLFVPRHPVIHGQRGPVRKARGAAAGRPPGRAGVGRGRGEAVLVPGEARDGCATGVRRSAAVRLAAFDLAEHRRVDIAGATAGAYEEDPLDGAGRSSCVPALAGVTGVLSVDQTVSNSRAERFRLDERFERCSISTPTTSFDSL